MVIRAASADARLRVGGVLLFIRRLVQLYKYVVGEQLRLVPKKNAIKKNDTSHGSRQRLRTPPTRVDAPQ